MGEHKNSTFDLYIDRGSLFLKGEITSQVSPLLMDAYHGLGTGDAVILDFSGMEHIDISGINALIKLYLHARAQDREVVAYGLSPYFREVFATTGIDKAIFVERSDFTRTITDIPREGSPWARPVRRLGLSYVPEGAINLNIEGLRPVGPVQ